MTVPSSVERNWPSDGPAAAFAWQIWPLRDEIGRHWPLLPASLAVGAFVAVAAASGWAGLAAVLLQWLALWRLWLPGRFEVNAQGISQQYLGRVRLTPWSQIGRCELHDDGLLLLPNDDPGPWDRWVAVYLPVGKYRDEVARAVATALASRNSSSARRTGGRAVQAT
jgi:hypothetical protein